MYKPLSEKTIQDIHAGSIELLGEVGIKVANDKARKIFARHGARVNAKNKYGLTAIIFAAQGGHAENVACLIAAGADLNAISKSGETALKLAEMSGHKDILELLKDNGAKE